MIIIYDNDEINSILLGTQNNQSLENATKIYDKIGRDIEEQIDEYFNSNEFEINPNE